MAPKRKSSDAGSASKPKRNRDVLSISDKLKILDMIAIEKISNAEIARLYGKNGSSIREVMKRDSEGEREREREIVLVFLLHSKLQT